MHIDEKASFCFGFRYVRRFSCSWNASERSTLKEARHPSHCRRANAIMVPMRTSAFNWFRVEL